MDGAKGRAMAGAVLASRQAMGILRRAGSAALLVGLASCLSVPARPPPTPLPDSFLRPLSSTLYWTLPSCDSDRACFAIDPTTGVRCVRGTCVRRAPGDNSPTPPSPVATGHARPNASPHQPIPN
jgi:hypothetical protein